jgi:Skp family chaperone for outer membrane proteins
MRVFCVMLAGLLLAPCAGADTVYKCLDAKGRVVYQSESCTSSHLKEAGRLDPVPEVPPEEVKRVRAETEKTRARLETKKKAEEESRAKAQQQELEERRVQALERQAQAAEEQARAAERQARAVEEEARTPNVIYLPARNPAAKPGPVAKPPYPSQRCAPGDWRCK